MRFSEKYGYSEPRQSIQVEELDQVTRNKLWNVYWKNRNSLIIKGFKEDVWNDYFEGKIDDLNEVNSDIKDVFDDVNWFQVVDLVEYISRYDDQEIEEEFNEVLEEEKSAYRIVDGEAVPVTDEIELEAIEEGMEKTRKYEGVREHLEQALAHFSDEKDPDYRNSVK